MYFPFVHMVWGKGMLADWGVLDFAGGIVVHNIAGMAALASVLFVGRRVAKIMARIAFLGGIRHRVVVVRMVWFQRGE